MILVMLLMLVMSSACSAEGIAGEELKAYCNMAFPPPVVQPHEPTGDEYFADAVLIGDSLMEYVEMYEELPSANYVWRIGMSPASVGRRQFRVKGTNERLTTYEQAALYHPKKVYVMLGSNGLDGFAISYVMADYEKMADDLIRYFPDAMIYVIAPPPMSQKQMRERHAPVSRYVEFAGQLKELAERRQFYFLNLYELLVDEEGCLPRKYDAGDGFHLTKRAYSILVDLIRRNTVPYPVNETEQKGMN
ncbi:MAG: hypothetical protein IJD39_03035 [Clostridia bacterium]|nr:hypothetical protein [Clostridia bacterium]